LSAVVDPAWNDAARVARSFTAGKGQRAQGTLAKRGNNLIRSRKAQKSPGRCRGF
jgi:hypothetical protein